MFLCKGLHRMCGDQSQHDPCSLIRPAECASMMFREFAYNLQGRGARASRAGWRAAWGTSPSVAKVVPFQPAPTLNSAMPMQGERRARQDRAGRLLCELPRERLPARATGLQALHPGAARGRRPAQRREAARRRIRCIPRGRQHHQRAHFHAAAAGPLVGAPECSPGNCQFTYSDRYQIR